MTTERYTQCPHCSATFKVTDEQLGIANGRVRCGACMNIFDAIAYSLPDKAEKSAKAHIPQTPAGDSPSASDLLMEDEDALFDDNPDEDKSDEGYSGSKQFSDELSDSFLALDEDNKPDNFSEHKHEPEKPEATDESWASGMLEEMSAQPTDRISSRSAKSKLDPAVDFAPAPARTQKIQHAAPPPKPVSAKPETNEPAPVSAPKSAVKESGADWYSPELTAPHPFEKLTLREPTRSYARSPLTSAVLWVSCILLVVLLLAQASWFHYETLARYPQIAALYQRACEHFSCQLPALSDIEKIRSNNLIVRSHPTLPKALIIETVLTNDAGFAQPFPDLGLYFSDINNKIIAQRRITPAEYLAGELLRWDAFPSDQPIHISLEIMDPGKEAVNYSLKFFIAQDKNIPITD